MTFLVLCIPKTHCSNCHYHRTSADIGIVHTLDRTWGFFSPYIQCKFIYGTSLQFFFKIKHVYSSFETFMFCDIKKSLNNQRQLREHWKKKKFKDFYHKSWGVLSVRTKYSSSIGQFIHWSVYPYSKLHSTMAQEYWNNKMNVLKLFILPSNQVT